MQFSHHPVVANAQWTYPREKFFSRVDLRSAVLPKSQGAFPRIRLCPESSEQGTIIMGILDEIN